MEELKNDAQRHKELLRLIHEMNKTLEEYKEEDYILAKSIYQDKKTFSENLIKYLKEELNIDYFYTEIVDYQFSTFKCLIKEESEIYETKIKNEEYLPFDGEYLCDGAYYSHNKDQIIIMDRDYYDVSNAIDLNYFNDILNFRVSFSDELKEKLTTFIETTYKETKVRLKEELLNKKIDKKI